MRPQQLERLKDLRCKDEQVAEDHATVLAETEGEKRLIPFVREENGWRFDIRSYASLYRDSIARHRSGRAKATG
jgi:hypothetical protein